MSYLQNNEIAAVPPTHGADLGSSYTSDRAPTLSFAKVHTAAFYDDAGFCRDYDAPYCYRHWHVSESSYGYCPRGHGKSLDSHR